MIKIILLTLKTKALNIIIFLSRNYNALFTTNLLFAEIVKKLNRRKCTIYFSEHVAKDKNLNEEDSENVIRTVRCGKIDKAKSTEGEERICFKNYFRERNTTYFVVVKYGPDFVRIITVIKEKGKY